MNEREKPGADSAGVAEGSEARVRWPSDISTCTCLVLALLSIYLITYNGVLRATDGQAMFVVAENLVKRASPDARQLDNWEDVHVGPDGLSYAKYPLGPSLAIVPFYKFGLLNGGRVGLAQTALLLPLFMTAFSGGVVFLTARRLGYTARASVIAGLLYGLATIAWVYTRDMWAEPQGAFFLALAFCAALSYRQQGKRAWILLSAAATLGLILTKTVNVVLSPFILLYAFDLSDREKLNRMDVFLFCLSIALAAGLVAGYNWARFGNPFDSGYDADEVFSTPVWEGGGGLLLSPAKGLFWFNPVLFLSAWGVGRFWKHHRRETLLILVTALVHLALFGAWWSWWGGESWGPRFLVPALPLFVLPLLSWLSGERIHWLGPAVIILSIVVQIVGLLVSEVYLPSWSIETFRTWFLPAHWGFGNWPFVGHLLQFDIQRPQFAWLWLNEAGLRHFDGFLLGGLVLNGALAAACLWAVLFLRRSFPGWIAMGGTLITIALLLVRIESDARYITKLAEPSPYQAAYEELLTQLPPDVTVILTDKRVEPYFFNHHVAANVWYTLAKPDHTETLDTVSTLLEREGGRVALITDDLDNTLLPYAIEQWLGRRGAHLFRRTLDGKVQMNVFELNSMKAYGEPVAPAPTFDFTADPEQATLPGIASLLGWEVTPGKGSLSSFSVYWIHRGKATGEPFFLRLVSADAQVFAEGVSLADQEAEMMGQMMTSRGELAVPADLSTADFYWQVGVYTSAAPSGELLFDLPLRSVAWQGGQ